MAIEWDSFNGHLQVGIDVSVSGSTATVKYYVANDGWAYSDPQKLTYTGSITGSTDYTNNLGGSHTSHQVRDNSMLVATKTKTVSPGVTYTFAASLSGAYDGSSPSASRTYKAPVDQPNAPTGVNASAITNGGATIKWTEPSDWGGHETGDYKLQYATNSGFTGATTLTLYNVTSKALTGLDSAQQYWVRVRAWNSAGDGTYSSTVTFTTLASASGAPGPITFQSIRPTTARALWSYPADDGGAPISSYEFQYSVNSDLSDPETVAGILVPQYDMSGLSPNTRYYTRVRAINAGGSGAWTASAAFTTQAGAKVWKSGAMIDVPTLVRVAGAFQPVAPQKRKAGAWVY